MSAGGGKGTVVVRDLELGGVVAEDVGGDAGIDWIVPRVAKADHYKGFGLCHDDSQEWP
jgi:hypothetical protein